MFRVVVPREEIYLFDAGMSRSLRPRGPLDRPEEIDGQALKGLVAQHLRAWTTYSRQGVDLFHWRTRAGTEVDFVVYGESGLQAFAVKKRRKVYSAGLRSLRGVREDYPEAETAVLYRGSERLRIGDSLCLPVEDFLRGMTPNRRLLT